jgi:ABC-type uncharacterized transport system ATPase subunit
MAAIMQAADATRKNTDQGPALCRPISVRSASLARAAVWLVSEDLDELLELSDRPRRFRNAASFAIGKS